LQGCEGETGGECRLSGGRLEVRIPSLRLTGKLGAAVGTQAVPLGGVLGGWSPATGLVLYWAEAVLGVLLALAMVWLYRRRISDPRQDEAVGPPGSPAAEAALRTRLTDLARANLRPHDIAIFYGGSLAIFGAFFAGIMLILSHNHGVAVPSLAELQSGLPPLVGFAVLGFLLDLRGLGRRPASFVAARVDAGAARWAMLWAVGFFGTILMAVSGRPTMIFLVFAALKTLYEVGVALERVTSRKPGLAA
jgi:Family of unknown function (DUF6498)